MLMHSTKLCLMFRLCTYLSFSLLRVQSLISCSNLCVVLQALKSVVLYVVLSPYDNEQSDLVHRISADKKLEEIPKYKYLSFFFLSFSGMGIANNSVLSLFLENDQTSISRGKKKSSVFSCCNRLAQEIGSLRSDLHHFRATNWGKPWTPPCSFFVSNKLVSYR